MTKNYTRIAAFGMSLSLVLSLLLGGCASGAASLKKANDAVAKKDYETAINEMTKATNTEPENQAFKQRLDSILTEARKYYKEFLKGEPKSLPLVRLQLKASSEALSHFSDDDSFWSSAQVLKAAENKLTKKRDSLLQDAKKRIEKKEFTGAAKLLEQADQIDQDYAELLVLRKQIAEGKGSSK